ncbi:MAG: Fe-S protein assembly co-chaperone HscB [Pseudomonadota bacterium]
MQFPEINHNFFELFSLKADYDINLTDLHAEQQRLQSVYHPDRFVGASDQDRRASVQTASRINQAYETLRDPVKRAFYLLELKGAAKPDDSQTTSDTAFLMEQMELREAMDSCHEASNPMLRSEEIAESLLTRQSELSNEFVSCYQSGDLEAASSSCQKMQFVQRLQQQLNELQYELEDA